MNKTLTAIVMVLGLVALTACEKPGETPSKDGNSATGKSPTMQAAPGATTQPAATAPAAGGDTKAPAAAASAEKLVPIPLELPKPRFSGTPKNLPPGTRVKITKGVPKPREPFLAPEGVTNVALKKAVLASDMEPVIGTLDMVTDGEKEAVEDAFVELGLNRQWVQVDLGQEYEIFAIVIWREHKDPRVYKDVVVKVAADKDFIEGVETVYNNDHDNSIGEGLGEAWEFFETNEGQLVKCMDDKGKGVKARYVRAYSNGNTVDELNRYTEIEVYARPVK